ncbi:MAG: hypothetical protein EBR89_11790 [Betaproteobacteria bacterium]|nr:hypothetical protein [Betaproteobacteria bacterium]
MMNFSLKRLSRPAAVGFVFATFIFAPQVQAQMGADQINMNGQYVLAAKAGKVERVGQLLRQGAEQGADKSAKDNRGQTAFDLAREAKQDAVLPLLQ